MSSPDRIAAWRPPDLDPAARGDALAVALGIAVSEAGLPESPSAVAIADWSPAALEERRPPPRQRVQSERERGFDEGIGVGRSEGHATAQLRLEPALLALEGLLGRLDRAETEFARERERNLITLALVVARKLVQQEIEVRPDTLQALVTRALELIPAGAAAEVRMNPDDLEAIAPGIEKLAVEGRAPAAQWIGDPSLERGSFVVESPTRVVDGRVDSALRQLYERLDHD